MTNPALRSAAASADYDRWLLGQMPQAEFVRRTEERIALMLIATPICDQERIAELTAVLREEWQA